MQGAFYGTAPPAQLFPNGRQFSATGGRIACGIVMQGAEFHHARLHDIEDAGERVTFTFSVLEEFVHASARLREQGTHGAPRIAFEGELSARRGVFSKSFAKTREALYQRTVAVDRGARTQDGQRGLQLFVELLGSVLELVARCARLIKGRQRFAERA